MRFYSVLYKSPDEERAYSRSDQPEFFVDLALDQILAHATVGRDEYALASIYYAPLSDPDAILYRQEAVSDLQHADVMAAVTSFAVALHGMRSRLRAAEKSHYVYESKRWFLDAVQAYCAGVRALAEELEVAKPRSRALLALLAHLQGTITSDDFRRLEQETTDLRSSLNDIRYDVRVRGNAVRVHEFAEEVDYSTQVLSTFQKFRESPVKDYRVKLPGAADMNHVEAQIVECVAKLFPDVFARLDAYPERNHDYLDERLAAFGREVQFYVGYLELVGTLEHTGLAFCLPGLVAADGATLARAMFDLALAAKLAFGAGSSGPNEVSDIVPNDVRVAGEERFLVVTGPNQGGKTTFARAFGQLHYLAALGLPVPAAEATLPTIDRLFPLFQRQEQVEDLRGALHDELLRIHAVLEEATPNSLIVMNEALSTTTAGDALAMLRAVLGRIEQLGTRCLLVTFLDELSSFNEHTVSLVGSVDPADPAIRTYEIVRRPADGRAYAVALASKYALTKDALAERMSR